MSKHRPHHPWWVVRALARAAPGGLTHFAGINTIGKAEGGDAKHGHLPLESRRAFRRLREPDFSPARGNLPTLEYLTTPSAPRKALRPKR